MNVRLAEALHLLPDYLGQHVVLCACALALALIISLPLSVAAARSPRLRGPVLSFASLVQTIPGLALLALFYPLLLALSGVTQKLFGVSLPALGFLPALLALTLYAMLPIIRNTVAALDGIDPAIMQAADGVGMDRRQKFLQVEVPLAAPVAMAGIRTAAVWTIGTATLATPVGQTSLGNFIFTGLQTENGVFVLVGCAASAALALVADALLALIENGLKRSDMRRVIAGLVLLALGTLAALLPAFSRSGGYVVGAKNFSEQFILADLVATRIEAAGMQTQQRRGLGSAVIFRALAANDIDVYVDYSGTLWANVMQRIDNLPRETMIAEITRFMRDTHGVVVLGALGFENAYALAMNRARAQALGIANIADLAGRSSALTFGSDLEFLQRPEWRALRDAYGLSFKETRTFNPTFMYRALAGGEADVIPAFSSDGRIAADNLVVLADPKRGLPSYDALILIAPKRANDALLRDALTPLLGRISVEAMREANYSVDRDAEKATIGEAARALARKIGAP